MSIGMILLTVTAILVFFGAAQRVLDKLYLSDRTALLLIACMFLGTLIPNINISTFSVSIGGAVIPVGICIYLLVKADTAKERIRALGGSLLTGAAVYGISVLLPAEPEALPVDPMYLYGVAGGLAAYVLGRSRRGAFVCGVLGVLWADIAVALFNRMNGIQQQTYIGGAGVFDAMVISGILGVLLAELVGELIERIVRSSNEPVPERVKSPFPRKER